MKNLWDKLKGVTVHNYNSNFRADTLPWVVKVFFMELCNLIDKELEKIWEKINEER